MMATVFKQLKCLIPSRKGGTCNAYFCDVEIGKATGFLRFVCRHHTGHLNGHSKTIEFKLDEFGVVHYREVPDDSPKAYVDDGVRVGFPSEGDNGT